MSMCTCMLGLTYLISIVRYHDSLNSSSSSDNGASSTLFISDVAMVYVVWRVMFCL